MVQQANKSFRAAPWAVLILGLVMIAAMALGTGAARAHGAWLGGGTIDVTDATQAQIVANVEAGEQAVQNGDIIEVMADFPVIVAGTIDGPGGYATMYVPNGVEVVGAFITDAAGNPVDARPARSSSGSGISKGWGPKGQLIFDVSANGWQPSSSANCTAAGYSVAECNSGMAYIYGDTGVFYSTRADTALFANGSDRATLENGYLVDPSNGTPWGSVGGTGTARVHNKWDAVHVNAFGSGGSIFSNGFTAAEETAINPAGRGSTPFMSGSPVAGPQSGSPWDRYGTTGPWNRVQYAGSCRADDPNIPLAEGPANGAGSVAPETTDPGVNSVDVCTVTSEGTVLNDSDLSALPAEANAVRFAFGGITEGEVFYAKLRVRVTDIDALTAFNAEGHGGDSAEGAAAGNDNPWRYWVAGSSSIIPAGPEDAIASIQIVSVNGAPYSGGDIPQSATLRYRVNYATTSLDPMTNGILQVTLPAQTVATGDFHTIRGPHIEPAVNPSGGTFSFQTIADLDGLAGGAVEFDVRTGALSGETVTASTTFSTDQAGPSNDAVSANVAAAPVDLLPTCTGLRFSAVDWAADAPGGVGQTKAFSRFGFSGTVSSTTNSATRLLRPADIGTSNQLYAAAYGGNPILSMQYVDLTVTFSEPLNGTYFYLADLDVDEGAIIYGEAGGQLVSPAVADGPLSVPLLRQTNPDGSVLVERASGSSESIDETFAALVGFNQPVDKIVIRHLDRQNSPASLAGSARLTDVQICADFTDAPSVIGDAFHAVSDYSSMYLGAGVDGDAGPGDAPNADSDSDDGVDLPPMTQGFITIVTADVVGPGHLQGWIDFDGDNAFTTPGERVALDLMDDGTGADEVAEDGKIQIEVTVPGDAVLDQTYARFRWSEAKGLDEFALAKNGEVEDYALTISAAPLVDRGDAPAAGTTYGDPMHVLVPGIYLGAGDPDADSAPQNNADATGDDIDGNDDEDGIVLPQLYADGTVEMAVDVGELIAGVSYLQVWIDFDGDGSFDTAGDQVVTDLQDGGALDKDGATNGRIVFDVTTPATVTTLPTFARFRWSTVAGVTNSAPVGDGEVEDYQITFSFDAPPLVCDNSLFQIATKKSTLKKLSFGVGATGYTLALQDIGGADANLNSGWGYNTLDGYIYGVKSGKDELWRIDGRGEFTLMSKLPNGAADGTVSGDILPNGVMIYPENATTMQLLDITSPAAPVDLGRLTLGSAISSVDMAYNPVDGMIYGVNGSTDRLFAFSANGGAPGTVTVTEFGPAIYAGTFGAVWFDEDGRFYAYENNSNEIYLIDVGTNGSGSGNRQLLATSTDDEGGTNDGAGCRGPAPIPLGSIAGNVFVDQNASDVKEAGEPNLGAGIRLDLYDDMGTPNDLGDDVFIATTDTLTDGTYRFDDLAAAGTYRVTVDEADPDLPPNSTIGTSNPLLGIEVPAGATQEGVDFGFDGQQADLSITKTAIRVSDGSPATFAAEGEVLDWVISVTNDGSGSPSNVKVLELVPSGYTYLSDDAPETGDYYDPDTGLWFVDEILSGATETLTIRVRVNGSGERRNVAEIIESSLPDPDSDPGVGYLNDDFNDGIADDDEAVVTVTLDNGTGTLSGRLFVDNGAGAATAHDGVIAGGETGSAAGVLAIYDAGGGLVAQPEIATDGSWSYTRAKGQTGDLTLTVTPASGYLTVSEATTGLPGVTAGDPSDGSFSFSPADGADYGGLDFGLIETPVLGQDQTASIEPGQIASLPHRYIATSEGEVSFTIQNQTANPANGFTSAIYRDADCDGQADTVQNGPLPVVAGEEVCLVVRSSAGAGIGPQASYSYDLVAETVFTGIAVSHSIGNSDRLESGGGQGQLVLTKTVENETVPSGEGTVNAGGPGDILRYRIYLINPSARTASDVVIYDRTPAYTALSEPIPSPVDIGPGLQCSIAVPASNVAGYAGPLRWDCTGSYLPGAAGAVSFRVQITP